MEEIHLGGEITNDSQDSEQVEHPCDTEIDGGVQRNNDQILTLDTFNHKSPENTQNQPKKIQGFDTTPPLSVNADPTDIDISKVFRRFKESNRETRTSEDDHSPFLQAGGVGGRGAPMIRSVKLTPLLPEQSASFPHQGIVHPDISAEEEAQIPSWGPFGIPAPKVRQFGCDW
eukprot:TRINITY_DN43839_c0_g1_i1.p1 TRINITY_DN43839_c0_g1~~TRINITY_DN43839_c0_g1_i1.p1  ORF type:complete len:183 (+),score=35.44 TRINITY_DN43839_c0_g1_i1:31-549(+)